MSRSKLSARSEDSSVDLGFLNIFFVLIGIGCLLLANPLESIFSILLLKIILQSHWKQNVIPVVPLLMLIPWIEICTAVLEANINRARLDELLHGTGEQAFWLSAIGLLIVNIGFLIASKRKAFPFTIDSLQSHAQNFSTNRLMIIYFLLGPALSFVKSFFPYGGAFYQITTYLNEISGVVFILIIIQSALLKRSSPLYIFFIVVVTILSFYSLFSSWKSVAFALFLGYGTVTRLTRKVIFRMLIFLLIFGNLIFVWQAIKSEYRYFITGSESRGKLSTQAVVVDRREALNKFFELSSKFYSDDISDQENLIVGDELINSTLRRTGYLEFFSMTLINVPNEIPFEGGKLMADNLNFALIPRFLNPSKGVKDDGAKTTKYTGFIVSQNSSFSLGHYTEYYIDFGKYGMMICLFIYGIWGGWLHQVIFSRGNRFLNPLMVIALTYVILDRWGTFQTDSITLYGQTFYKVVCHLFLFIPIYKVIEKLTLKNE